MTEHCFSFHCLFRWLTLHYLDNIEFNAMIICHTYCEHKPKGENVFIFLNFVHLPCYYRLQFQKIRRWRGLHKHTISMQVCGNQSTVRKFKWRDSQINGQLHVHKHIMVFAQGRRYFLRNEQYATSGMNARRWTSKLQSFNNIKHQDRRLVTRVQCGALYSLQNIVRNILSRRMRWLVPVECVEGKRKCI
jgi:hypothetical protein